MAFAAVIQVVGEDTIQRHPTIIEIISGSSRFGCDNLDTRMMEDGPAMTDSSAKPCPKCGHIRAVNSPTPAWQCPQCGIAYAKYAGYLERKRLLAAEGLLERRPAETPVLQSWRQDRSLWGLVGANVLTLLIALIDGWSLLSIMLVYWGQSVIIGLANVYRMLSLDRFSTEGVKTNGRKVLPTRGTQISMSLFFLVHYGLFHGIYLFFIYGFSVERGDPLQVGLPFLLVLAIFGFNHVYSLRYNMLVDQRGTPNIGTLMFLPYFRVLPMHFTIFGLATAGSVLTTLLFLSLKTGADVGMHLVEHHHLSKAGADKPDVDEG